MNSNVLILTNKQLNDLSTFLRKMEYPFENISKEVDIEDLATKISEKFDKTISQGQTKALIRRVLKVPLTSTERSQLYELRQKIQKYERFLTYFGEWGYKYDYELKIIMFGLKDEESEMLSNIFTRPKLTHDRRIIGVNFYTKLIENLDNSLTNLQIWDIADCDRFKLIRSQYYKGAAAAILVFDKSNSESFELIKKFSTELKDKTGLKFTPKKGTIREIKMPIALIGKGKTRNITMEKIYSTVKDLEAQYFDIEDLYDKKLQEAFIYSAYQVMLRFKQ
ncbi:MAG: hypothetical protein ACFFKA_10670 [Candidatus Thorarchaeota archaeon]